MPLVTNSGAPITLKHGVHLGNFEILDLSSLEDSPPLPVAGVSAQSSDADLSDVVVHSFSIRQRSRLS